MIGSGKPWPFAAQIQAENLPGEKSQAVDPSLQDHIRRPNRIVHHLDIGIGMGAPPGMMGSQFALL